MQSRNVDVDCMDAKNGLGTEEKA